MPLFGAAALPTAVGAAFKIGNRLIDHFFPDQETRDKAKLELLQMEQSGELKELDIRMSAIIAEAQSTDPWTSRARPSFLYVIYTIILASIPMGILHAFDPTMADNISHGFRSWLDAIPSEMWYLFGAGYLGYSGARQIDKNNQRKEMSKWITEKRNSL